MANMWQAFLKLHFDYVVLRLSFLWNSAKEEFRDLAHTSFKPTVSLPKVHPGKLLRLLYLINYLDNEQLTNIRNST